MNHGYVCRKLVQIGGLFQLSFYEGGLYYVRLGQEVFPIFMETPVEGLLGIGED